jgi:hypothetical protein
MKKEKPYRILPGKKRSSFRTSTLWAGPDHLLLVETAAGFSETYRRFYFKDIQSITIRKTNTSLVIQGVITLLTLVSAYITYDLARSSVYPGAGFQGAVCFVMLAYLIGSLINGTSCECWIATAVGKEKIPSAHYLRPTLKMLAMVAPIIEKAQGRIDADAIGPGNFKALEIHDGKPAPQPSDTIGQEPGAWHSALFLCMIGTATLSIILLFHRPVMVIIISSILFIATSILAIIAVVKQTRSTMKTAIRYMTWSALGYIIVRFIESNIMMFQFLILNSKKGPSNTIELDIINHYSRMNPFDHPMILRINIALITVACIIGFGGLGLLRRES